MATPTSRVPFVSDALLRHQANLIAHSWISDLTSKSEYLTFDPRACLVGRRPLERLSSFVERQSRHVVNAYSRNVKLGEHGRIFHNSRPLLCNDDFPAALIDLSPIPFLHKMVVESRNRYAGLFPPFVELWFERVGYLVIYHTTGIVPEGVEEDVLNQDGEPSSEQAVVLDVLANVSAEDTVSRISSLPFAADEPQASTDLTRVTLPDSNTSDAHLTSLVVTDAPESEESLSAHRASDILSSDSSLDHIDNTSETLDIFADTTVAVDVASVLNDDKSRTENHHAVLSEDYEANESFLDAPNSTGIESPEAVVRAGRTPLGKRARDVSTVEDTDSEEMEGDVLQEEVGHEGKCLRILDSLKSVHTIWTLGRSSNFCAY